MDFYLDEWKAERERHPFFGEKLPREKISEIWDNSAESYSDESMGDIPDRIVALMVQRGIIQKKHSILDIGCGPGVYGLRFSKHAKNVTCLDDSLPMLGRLQHSCVSEGIDNIRPLRTDWMQFHSDDRYDVVFSSLCPPLNHPDMILGMEAHANEWCAYVSSMNDDRGSLHMSIWKEFGKDYTFNGYNTNYPFEYLKSVGRSPTLDEFEFSRSSVQKIEDVVMSEISKFSVYMRIDAEKRKIIEEIISSFSENGEIISEGKKKVGLLIWAPFKTQILGV